MDQGRVLFRGTPRQLMDTAAGHVWVSDQLDPNVAVASRTGEGHYRHIGPTREATMIEPIIEDGYLLLVGDATALNETTAS